MVLMFCGFFTSLIYFYSPWREKYLPKYNAGLINLFTLGTRVNRLKITPDKLYHNMFIIPKFKNIILEYEFNDDFGKYIKNIDITALKKLKKGRLVDDCYNFKAIFTFSNPVKDGFMKIKYI